MSVQNAAVNPFDNTEIIDIDELATSQQANTIEMQQDVESEIRKGILGEPQDRSELLRKLFYAGMTSETYANRVKQGQYRASIVSEKSQLIKDRAGREAAVHAKIALVADHKVRVQAMADELWAAERKIIEFDQMADRIRAIDTELRNTAGVALHNALSAAESTLMSASQRRQELLPQFDQANFRVSELEKYIADPKYRMSDHQYTKTNDEASIDLKDARDFVSRLQPQMTAADNKMAEAQKAFDAAKAALLSA